jgi:hypothetical protein
MNTLKILHFGVMTIEMIGTIGICGMGEPTVRRISDRVGLDHFSGPRPVNLGHFPGFIPVVWVPELPMSAIPSRPRDHSFGSLFLWDSERIDSWQRPDRRKVPHSPYLDESATFPKSISLRPKSRWTSDSYNFLLNVEEKTSVC